MDTFLHRKAKGSNTPHAARRIGSEPLVRGFALGYRSAADSVCFAQSAALLLRCCAATSRRCCALLIAATLLDAHAALLRLSVSLEE